MAHGLAWLSTKTSTARRCHVRSVARAQIERCGLYYTAHAYYKCSACIPGPWTANETRMLSRFGHVHNCGKINFVIIARFGKKFVVDLYNIAI